MKDNNLTLWSHLQYNSTSLRNTIFLLYITLQKEIFNNICLRTIRLHEVTLNTTQIDNL